MARGRSGIQYASTTIKKCPMYDDACAIRIIEQIANRMTRGAHTQASVAGNIVNEERTIAMYVDTIRVLRDQEVVDDNTQQAIRNLEAEIVDRRKVIAAWQQAGERITDPKAEAAKLVEEKCGRYTRGQHVGKLRGWASIEVVTEGGWKKYGPGERNGRVVRPGTVLSIRIGDDFTHKTYLEVGD